MVTIDSDGQHDPHQISKLLEPILNDGYDLVIGSRFLNSSKKIPKYRSFGIRTITKLMQSASYDHITDAQCGFRAYGKKAISLMNLYEDGMAVSTEILLQASENNLSVKEVPIIVNYDLDKTSTHNPFSHGISVLSSIFQFISIRHPLIFYGLPGIIMLSIAIGYMNFALELFSESRYISTNAILVSVGSTIVGIVLVATAVLLYSMSALMRGKVK